MPPWTAADMPDQSGKTALVTGASSGLGLRASEALARKGALVLLGCRNPARASIALARVREVATGPDPIVLPLDLASFESVRLAAAEVLCRFPAIDILMNNAGIAAVPRAVTSDGFESQIATNHLGPFALTGRLLPALRAARQGRVVTVASGAHKIGRMRLEHPKLEAKRYRRWGAYAQSKLANLLFTSELHNQATDAGAPLLAVAAHPGYAATNLSTGSAEKSPGVGAFLRVGDRLLAQTDENGALPQLYAATMPDVRSNDYWGPDSRFEQRGHPARVLPSKRASDAGLACQLWARSEELTGVVYRWT